jgi:hypothetical protein
LRNRTRRNDEVRLLDNREAANDKTDTGKPETSLPAAE